MALTLRAVPPAESPLAEAFVIGAVVGGLRLLHGNASSSVVAVAARILLPAVTRTRATSVNERLEKARLFPAKYY